MKKTTKNTLTRSSTPSFFSCSTTLPRLLLRISGYVCSIRSPWKLDSVSSLKHYPGRVRPARPARWCADAREIGDTSRLSTRERGL